MRSREPSPWDAAGTVAGFEQAPPNAALLALAREERARPGALRALDLGCGAGRNAVPLARAGWVVTGLDDSEAMLAGAARRALEAGVGANVGLVRASMDHVPARAGAFDLVVAHGIWNLARTGGEFRAAVHEAARVARDGAALFVFTFSRHTLAPDAGPVAGESFVFTQLSGRPQCFLTEAQLVAELAAAGFVPHPGLPLRELNRPALGALAIGSGPVVYEAAFRRER